MTYGAMFMLLFPVEWVKTTMLTEMNKVVEGPLVTFVEFLRFLGLWFFMATVSGFSRHDFFSSTEINCQRGAPYCLN